MKNFIIFKNKHIYYQIYGKGQAIVLLHGFMESMEIWNDIALKRSKKYRVITIDLPGHGKSENIDSIHSIHLMAEAVHAVLQEIQVSSCIMIGHSMGGYVTLEFADLYKSYLKGFGLFHSHPLEDSVEVKNNRNKVIEAVNQNHKIFVTGFFPALFAKENIDKFSKEIKEIEILALKMSKESINAAVAGMRDRSDKTQTLINAKAPFLAILGKEDFRIPLNSMLPTFILAEKSCINVLDHVGHMGFIEAKEDSIRIISGFADFCFRK